MGMTSNTMIDALRRIVCFTWQGKRDYLKKQSALQCSLFLSYCLGIFCKRGVKGLKWTTKRRGWSKGTRPRIRASWKCCSMNSCVNNSADPNFHIFCNRAPKLISSRRYKAGSHLFINCKPLISAWKNEHPSTEVDSCPLCVIWLLNILNISVF